MQILLVGDTHELSCDIAIVKVLLFVTAPAFIEASNSKEYVAALSKLGAIPEIILSVTLMPVPTRSVSEFPEFDTEIKL